MNVQQTTQKSFVHAVFSTSERFLYPLVLSILFALTAVPQLGCTSPASRSDTPASRPASRSTAEVPASPAAAMKEGKTFEVQHSVDEWKKLLTPEQFNILREAGTERPFTGKFHDHKKDGTYVCAACGKRLYRSADKFDSGTGWPSYTRPIEDNAVVLQRDATLGMVREELVCARCGGHLGHRFNDGPAPTGQRHCINSGAMEFVAE